MVGLPFATHSLITHDSAAAAAAICVTTKALTASPFAPRAEPALKPNQPTHNNEAPITVNGKLCGAVGSTPYPSRLPIIRIATRAEIPDLMWTTVPPAKSSPPRLRSQPPVPQTQ